jgi:hypothetical protein
MIARLVGNKVDARGVKKTKHLPSSNTACIITLAALTDAKYVIHAVQWSYTAAPTGGRLTIAFGASPTTELDVDIISGGPGGFGLDLAGAKNEQMVVTLSAGGSGITGKLNIQYIKEAP